MTGKRCLAMLAGVVGISTGAMAQQSVRRDALPAVTQQQPVLVQQQVPPMPAILMLLRSTVIAVTQSNASGSYENLRALGTTAFRNANSNERLSQVFEPLRRLGYDLSPVLVTAPEVSEPPMVMANGMLRIVGVFPTRPVEVPFAPPPAAAAARRHSDR